LTRTVHNYSRYLCDETDNVNMVNTRTASLLQRYLLIP